MYIYIVHMYVYIYTSTQTAPVGTDGGEISNLIVVHPALALQHEAVLLPVSPDAGHSQDGLLEV